MIQTLRHSDNTETIIKGFYNVYNKLGYGFLENVYEKALFIELTSLGLKCLCQCPVEVYYKSEKVGFYIADMIVNSCVVVEIKATAAIILEHEAQLTNYLRATEIEIGLLLNFGKSATFKRKIVSTDYY